MEEQIIGEFRDSRGSKLLVIETPVPIGASDVQWQTRASMVMALTFRVGVFMQFIVLAVTIVWGGSICALVGYGANAVASPRHRQQIWGDAPNQKEDWRSIKST